MKGKIIKPIDKLQFEIKVGKKIIADKTIKNILIRDSNTRKGNNERTP